MAIDRTGSATAQLPGHELYNPVPERSAAAGPALADLGLELRDGPVFARSVRGPLDGDRQLASAGGLSLGELLRAGTPAPTRVDAQALEELLSRPEDEGGLSLCEAFQLTQAGYLQHVALRARDGAITAEGIIRLVQDRTRSRSLTGYYLWSTPDYRDSVADFAKEATSYQASVALVKLVGAMDSLLPSNEDRAAVAAHEFQAMLDRVYQNKLDADPSIVGCVQVKWGNMSPDFHAYPLYAETMADVRRIFETVELTDDERTRMLARGFTADEAKELKALSHAAVLMEGSIEFLAEDLGGFEGNPKRLRGAHGADGEFVCTDEMVTHALWIDYLISEGLVTQFDRQPQFAHRARFLDLLDAVDLVELRVPASDHFGVHLTSRRDPSLSAVYDTWIPYGAEPAIVSPLEAWENHAEEDFFLGRSPSREEVIAVKDQIIAAAGGISRVALDDRQVPGHEVYHFSIDTPGWPDMRDKYGYGYDAPEEVDPGSRR